MNKISIEVNGILYKKEVASDLRLMDFLREDLRLTGTKEGCGEGECGACTVIMEGKAVNSCLVLAASCNNSQITTIEGVSTEELHPLQKAFIEVGAVQCGYCTPGMILSAKALLDKSLDISSEDVREAISGNLCRCTGYQKIVEAIELARDYLKRR
jgi:carbon-monoxide dehydrogenase small subunit